MNAENLRNINNLRQFFKFYRILASVVAKFKQPLLNFEAENRKKLSNLRLVEKQLLIK